LEHLLLVELVHTALYVSGKPVQLASRTGEPLALPLIVELPLTVTLFEEEQFVPAASPYSTGPMLAPPPRLMLTEPFVAMPPVIDVWPFEEIVTPGVAQLTVQLEELVAGGSVGLTQSAPKIDAEAVLPVLYAATACWLALEFRPK
jgi:hypothetical protein